MPHGSDKGDGNVRRGVSLGFPGQHRACFFIILLLGILLPIAAGTVFAAEQNELRAPKDDLFSVTFPDETHGWACGRWGTVIHTSDGGKTWSRQQTGTDFTLSSICFPDNKHGWAVGDEGTIINTSDGGKSWQSQKSPVPFFLMGVHFANPREGWIATERTHILHTENGGQTWTVQFKDEDFILKAVSFCDAYNGWAVGEYGYIYHTKDGKTWSRQAGSFHLSEETGQAEGGDQLFGVMALDASTAWAVGIDGCVTKTTDGGKSWRKVNARAPKTQLFAVTGDKGGAVVIMGKRAFLVSLDRGETWANPGLDPPFPYGWIYGLARRGAAGFAAVGQQGAIYLGNAGSWQRIN
jgi:photosystem II stability/assembly factor-like uncharacterized protein